MSPPRLLHILVPAVLMGGLGYYIGRQHDSSPPAPALPAKTSPAPPPPPAPAKATVPAGLAAYAVPVTAANAASLTTRALTNADPVARMAASMLLVASMTPDNARAIYQAYIDSTTKEGRKHDGEWALMLRRYGEVMGATALEDVKADPFNAALVVEGLAAHDPAAALAALKASGLEGPGLTGAWLTGLCRKDPQQALTLALSGDYNNADGTGLLDQAINSLGLDGASAAFQKALDAAPEKAATSPVFRTALGTLGNTLFHKNWTLGTPQVMLPWLEQQKDQYLPDTFIDRAAHDNMLKGDPVQTLDFLDRMNAGRPLPRGGEQLFTAFIEAPQILSGMSAANCARVMKYFPANDPARLLELVMKMETINPDRAAQLKTALPQ